MKKYINLLCLLVLCFFMFTSCLFGNLGVFISFSEVRSDIIAGTNIIGIVGEPADEPYIEICYSVADEENDCNITETIWVTPPYIFQNNKVYITYKYEEWSDNKGPFRYEKNLIRDFEEGGAEYLRIINHSDNPIEFFIAEAPWEKKIDTIPSYKKAPVYYLLHPEQKPNHNIHYDVPDYTVYFEDDRIGDLTVKQAWSPDEIIELYRSEYERSNEIILMYDNEYRIIDLIEGKVLDLQSFTDNILYGIIAANEELLGYDKIWLLSISPMFWNEFESGPL